MNSTVEQNGTRSLRIATRGSRLALWQAHWVQDTLKEAGVSSELVIIETQGDRSTVAFSQMQGQGFFTKAVQDAVLANKADLAVHSMKDLPSAPFPGLQVAAIPKRADSRDILLSREPWLNNGEDAIPLKEGAIVGTSAARRQAQLKAIRPDLEVRELRGNVPTRIQKLRDGQYDAIVLALAGISRLELDLSDLHTKTWDPSVFVPAPAQGALAIECRSDDPEVIQLLQKCLHNEEAAKMVGIERGLMARFDGGCQLALGAHAFQNEEGLYQLHAFYKSKKQSVQGQDGEGLIDAIYQQLSD